MARRRTTWWWLAVPLAGIAAYAGFVATLSYVGRPEAPPGALAPAAPPAASLEEALVQPASPPELPRAAIDGAPPMPSATAADERAAASSGGGQKTRERAAKRKLPREDLTEQDRRALERVLERAAEQRDPP
ncbi:MAG: hypothetical protein AB1689_08910 [Thermodesulfobacteriota bacterium]